MKKKKKNYLLKNIQTDPGVHPASYIVGTEGTLSTGVKRTEREADHSPAQGQLYLFSWYLIVAKQDSHKDESQNSRCHGRLSNPAPSSPKTQ
jgi:hypothetical protein